MKKYTEEDLRKAFRAGGYYSDDVRTNGNYCTELDEDEFINGLKESAVEEDKISFTYAFLRRKLDWEDFCILTGTSVYAKREGYEIKDSEMFYIAESKAKQFNLI